MMHTEPHRQDIYDYIKAGTVYNTGVQMKQVSEKFGMSFDEIRRAIVRFPPKLLVWESDDGSEVGTI